MNLCFHGSFICFEAFLLCVFCIIWVGCDWTHVELREARDCLEANNVLILSRWRTANLSVRLKSACSDCSWINNPNTASHANPCKWGLGAIEFSVCLCVKMRVKEWVCLCTCMQEAFSKSVSMTKPLISKLNDCSDKGIDMPPPKKKCYVSWLWCSMLYAWHKAFRVLWKVW